MKYAKLCVETIVKLNFRFGLVKFYTYKVFDEFISGIGISL